MSVEERQAIKLTKQAEIWKAKIMDEKTKKEPPAGYPSSSPDSLFWCGKPPSWYR
jgi:hypothetical protein